ncbi:MAG TPA: hypothetical protein VGF49_00105 [Candidatus Solibacter sp.]|jgi:Ca-activated chloride channel family protein
MRKSLAEFLLAVIPIAANAQIVLNPPRDSSVITVDVELVNVLASVRDRRGLYVKGLSQQDFEIREDGKRQEITHFAREIDTPVAVSLLLDISGSVAGIIGCEKSAGQSWSPTCTPRPAAMVSAPLRNSPSPPAVARFTSAPNFPLR